MRGAGAPRLGIPLLEETRGWWWSRGMGCGGACVQRGKESAFAGPIKHVLCFCEASLPAV